MSTLLSIMIVAILVILCGVIAVVITSANTPLSSTPITSTPSTTSSPPLPGTTTSTPGPTGPVGQTVYTKIDNSIVPDVYNLFTTTSIGTAKSMCNANYNCAGFAQNGIIYTGKSSANTTFAPGSNSFYQKNNLVA